MLCDLEAAIQEQIEATREGVLNDSPSSIVSAENATTWQKFVAETLALLDNRDQVIVRLNALDLLGILESRVRDREDELFKALETAVLDRKDREQKTALAEKQAEEYQEQYRIEHDWWETLHAAIPKILLEDWTNLETIHDIEYVQCILERVSTAEWENELTHQTSLVYRTEPLVHDWIERLRGSEERDANALRDLYVKNANVLGVTCGQVPRLTRRNPALNFDVVIVDEVSKATPPELLLPMAIGRKIILVGDHKQLPPMVQENSLQEVAEELDIAQEELGHFKQSLFGNLYNSSPQVLRHMLTEQYRMRPAIMRAINQFYEYQLTGGHQRAHNLPVVNLDNDTALAWVATPRDETYFEEQVGFSYSNPKEVEIIEQLLDQMNTAWQPRVDAGESPKEVGIITFYMAQFRLFRKRAWGSRFRALHIRIGTVDRFQGMERDVVIVSLVRNNPHRNIGFAKEPERINVAFSRARELLVIVGCQHLFAQSARNAYEATAAYAEISKIVQREGRVIHVSEFH